ncbi:MAG: phosphate/phosphite/phosphonate ABC transporter substrate-binding protein [Desulfobacteraceae bacterium]|nr:MAG: phosphate/phosphite/phosphonate ABC transporter substrate-binding protein [Desulfobacteraceae bacterium]
MAARIVSLLLFLLLIAAAGCQWNNEDEGKGSNAAPKTKEKLVIALVPEKNFFEQRRQYRYIADYLSAKLDRDVEIVIMESYGDISEAFRTGEADAGFFGSFSYLLTHARAGVIPIARPVWEDGSSTYRGYIFARKDSGIEDAADMRGKKLVLVDRATTAGYIFPLFYFQYWSVRNMSEFFSQIYFAGSHDAAAWAVYMGEADVGAAKSHVFNGLAERYPGFKEQMVTLAESPEMPSNGLAVRSDLNAALKLRLRDLLLGLDQSEEGRAVLRHFGALKFIETSDQDFEALYKMVTALGIDLISYPYEN